MDKQTKDDLKLSALLATDTLLLFELFKSMKRSKTLTMMVTVSVILATAFAVFLIKAAGA